MVVVASADCGPRFGWQFGSLAAHPDHLHLQLNSRLLHQSARGDSLEPASVVFLVAMQLS